MGYSAGIVIAPSGNVREDQVSVTSWTTSGSVFYTDVSHVNVQGQFVSVQVVKLSDFRKVNPKRIIHLNSTTTRVVMNSEIDVRINIHGSSF